MTFEDLQISHPVELDVSMGGKHTTFVSFIEHKVGTSVLLSPIKHNEKLVGFPVDAKISLHYIEDSRVYRWSHLSVKAVKYNGQVYHSAELAADAEILNRRGAFRVYIGERMPLTSFTASGPKKTEVLVKDISESGIAFLSAEEFDTGRTVRIQLTLNEQYTLQLTAQIVRTQELDKRQEILYGCKFVEKNNRLTAYLMKRQQEKQRKKSETRKGRL